MSLRLRSVETRFDARRFPGLEAWWDAADSATVTLDAGRVSQLNDKSGLGRHAANTTSGSTQPDYITAGQNGLNVVRFTAASVQQLTVASSTATFNFLHNGVADAWFIAVSKYATSANPNALYGLFGNNAASSANRGVFVGWDNRTFVSATGAMSVRVSNGSGLVANTLNSGNTAILAAYNNLVSAQTFVVQETLLSPGNATAAQRLRLRINGGAEAAANNKTETASTSNATYNLQLGALGNNAFPMEGDLCEFMIFSQVPTASACDVIRRYLGAKWGISVA